MIAIAILITITVIVRQYRIGRRPGDNERGGPPPSPSDIPCVAKVTVLYSLAMPEEDKATINTLLVGGLSGYEMVVESPDTVGPRDRDKQWIEEGLRESQAVLLVCSKEFQKEWEMRPQLGELHVPSVVKVSCSHKHCR